MEPRDARRPLPDRLRLPLAFDPHRLAANGVRCAMAAGSAWYLRLADPHSVANRGPADRVHMVIDAVVNGWIAALFERAA